MPERNWRLLQVQPWELAHVWPLLCADLDRAFSRVSTDMTPNLLRRAAEQKVVSFWIVADGLEAVASFAVAHTPDGQADVLALAGSDVSEWMPALIDEFELSLKQRGGRALVLDGRRGWARLLKSLGFSLVSLGKNGLVKMRKVL